MPNWMTTDLTITGNAEDIKAIKEQLGKSYATKEVDSKWLKDESGEGGKWVTSVTDTVIENPILSFWNIIQPKPEELDDYYQVVGSNGKSVNDSTGWYGWNMANWGCKWDASDVSTYEHNNNDTKLHYQFNTPWGLPDQALTTLSSQYPNLTFKVEYQEENGWGGEIEIKDGESESLLTYDSKCDECDGLDTESYCDDCDTHICNACGWLNWEPEERCEKHQEEIKA